MSTAPPGVDIGRGGGYNPGKWRDCPAPDAAPQHSAPMKGTSRWNAITKSASSRSSTASARIFCGIMRKRAFCTPSGSKTATAPTVCGRSGGSTSSATCARSICRLRSSRGIWKTTAPRRPVPCWRTNLRCLMSRSPGCKRCGPGSPAG